MRPGDVRFWTLPVSGHEDEAAWRPWLDAPERERAARFHRRIDRVHYVLAHALLRHALSSIAQHPPAAWRFERGVHGKPRLPADLNPLALDVSLAHTRGLVACAIGRDCQIGIDAEEIVPANAGPGPAAIVFARAERAALAATPEDGYVDLFFRYWSLREAYLKAVGLGLGFDPDSFVIATSPLSIAFPAGDDFPARWHFHEPRGFPHHAVAVAAGATGAAGARFDHVQLSALPSAMP